MNFLPNAEESRYRDRVRAIAESIDWAGAQAIRDEVKQLDAERFSVSFIKRLASEGLVGLAWSKPWGADASAAQYFLFLEELECQGLPGYGLVQNEAAGNVILRKGSAETKETHLPRLVAGEWNYCGGLSEPGAGSDLLALKTTAIRQGDEYVINGSKLWTSAAHIANWCTVVARSDPAATRNKGLSLLLVDMKSPGVSVRPVRTMGGWRVNAVFFDDVRVPVANRIGDEHQGWAVLTGRLDKERAMSFGGTETRVLLTRFLHRMAGRADALDGAQLEELGRLITDLESDRLMNLRVSLAAGRGEDISGMAAMSKVFGSELAQRSEQWLADVEGSEALYPEAGDVFASDVEAQLRSSTVLTIIGGTSEIQRNLVAGRSLDLPKST